MLKKCHFKTTHTKTHRRVQTKEREKEKKNLAVKTCKHTCAYSGGVWSTTFFSSFCSLMKLCVIPRTLFEKIIQILYSAAKMMLFENSVEFIYLQLNKLTFLPPSVDNFPICTGYVYYTVPSFYIENWEDAN
jgi:hypothetical protein